MKRFASKIALAGILAGVLSVPASAQQEPRSHGRFAGGGRQAFRCLRNLDLSDAQKTAIHAILQDSRTSLKTAHAAVKADFQKLDSDADAGASAAVLGQDYLTARADRQKIQDAMTAIQTQIAGQLTDDQKTKFQACSAALKAPSSRAGASF